MFGAFQRASRSLIARVTSGGLASIGVVCLSGALFSPPCLADEQGRRLDRYGEALPAGAVARMGGRRWRVDLNTSPLVCWFSGNTTVSAIDCDGNFFLLDAKHGKALRRRSNIFQLGGEPGLRVGWVSVAGDGRTVAIGNVAATVGIFDGLTGEQRKSWRHAGIIESIALSQDGSRVLTAAVDLTGNQVEEALRVWETESGRELRRIKFDQAQPIDLISHSTALSPDGRTIAWIPSFEGRSIQLLDVATGRTRDCPSSRELTAARIAFTPDGRRIVATSGLDAILSWEVATCKQIGDHAYDRASLVPEYLAISPDSRSLAVYGLDGQLRVFDLNTGLERWRLDRGPEWHGSVPTFAPDGKTLLASLGGTNRLLHRYSVDTGQSLDEADVHGGPVTCVCFSADGKRLITLGRDQTMRSWKASTGELERSSPAVHEWTAFAVSADRRYTASAKGEGVTAYVMATGAQHRQFGPGWSSVHAVGLSPDLRQIVAAGAESQGSPQGTMRWWDMATGRQLAQAIVHEGRVTDLFMSSDRRIWCALAIPPSPRDRLLLRITSTGRTVSSLHVAEDYCGLLAVSSDARTVVMSNPSGRRLALIETATAKPRLLWWLDEPASAAALSRDGRILATGHLDGSLRFWDAYNGSLLAARQAHEGQVYSVDFDPAGRYAATGSWDGTALVWDFRELALGPVPVPSPGRGELAKLWELLASGDAQEAYRSMIRLAALNDFGVAFLAQRIEPLPPPKSSAIMDSIRKLNDRRFARREQAVQELIGIGSAAEPALRTALSEERLPEVRLRIEKILSNPVEPMLSSEEVRTLRAIEVLERIGSAQARQALVKIKSKAGSGRTASEVAASLARLASR